MVKFEYSMKLRVMQFDKKLNTAQKQNIISSRDILKADCTESYYRKVS